MTDRFLQGERVFTGDSIETAQTIGYVNYKNDTNQLEIINVQGRELNYGETLTGEDSGHKQLIWDLNFNNRVIGSYYEWDMENTGVGAYITLDEGPLIGLDAHFTGKDSQDYQPDYILVLD